MYQNNTDGKFLFSDLKKFQIVWISISGSRSLPFHYRYCWSQQDSHSSETKSQRELYHRWSVSKNAKNRELPWKWRNWSCIFNTDLEHCFGRNVGNDFGVMLRGTGPHKPEFAYDNIRIHSLKIYTDLIEYNINGDTKAPLLQCFPFISKLIAADSVSTGQYMIYQTISNLQLRPLLKTFFHSIHIDLRDMSGEKYPFVSVGITHLVLTFRRAFNIHFWPNRR